MSLIEIINKKIPDNDMIGASIVNDNMVLVNTNTFGNAIIHLNNNQIDIYTHNGSINFQYDVNIWKSIFRDVKIGKLNL